MTCCRYPPTALLTSTGGCLLHTSGLQPYNLTKSEIVQLINHRPPSVVEIFLVGWRCGAGVWGCQCSVAASGACWLLKWSSTGGHLLMPAVAAPSTYMPLQSQSHTIPTRMPTQPPYPPVDTAVHPGLRGAVQRGADRGFAAACD